MMQAEAQLVLNGRYSFLKSTFNNSYLAASIAIVAIFANAGMDIATKLVASDISAWQGVFLRWGYASCLLLIIVFFTKAKDASPSNKKVHTLRLGLNLIGSAALFFALSNLDLWLTLTIFFMEPVFTVFFAALFLGEVFGVRKILSIIFCLVGVAVVLLPQSNDSTVNFYAVGIAFLGTMAWGVMHLVTQHYGKDQSTARLILYLAVFTTLASAAPAIATWQPISLNQHVILAVVAILGTIYSYLWIIALN